MEIASIMGISLGIPVNVLSIIIILIGLVLFITEWISIPVTGLILSILMGITGCMPMDKIYAGFASSAYIMIFGLLIVGDSLSATGLARAVGQKLTHIKALGNERVMFAAIFLLTGGCSAFFSNSATVAMMIPICASVVASFNGKLQNKYYIMGIGIAALIGGTLTRVGSAYQLAANDIVVTAGYEGLGMWDWAKVSGPCFIIALLYFLTIGFEIQKKVLDFDDVSPVPVAETPEEHEEIKITRPMVICACDFAFCVLSFIFNLFPAAVTALIGATVLFATKAMNFKQTMRNLDWNAMIAVAASTSFATGLDTSGGGQLIADTVLKLFGGETASKAALMVAAILISAALGQIMSVTGIAAILVPIFISISASLGISPQPFAYAIIIGACMGFATPVGNAAITQTMVGGYRFIDYVKIGGPLSLLLIVVNCILSPIMFG